VNAPAKVRPRYCPVTGNHPLRCSEEGFYRACAGFQKNLTERKRPYNKECGECRGAFVPPEVTFIQVTNFKRGKEMQTTCGFCGKEASVKLQYGDIMVCTGCSIIRSYAKNNPELLEKALVEVGRGGGPADTASPQEVCAQENEDRTQLERDYEELEKKYSMLQDSLDASDKIIGELEDRVEKLAEPTPVSAEQVPVTTIYVATPSKRRQQLAWTLAEAKITGDVELISMDDIRYLRDVQLAAESAV
jgi:hypothetical protein